MCPALRQMALRVCEETEPSLYVDQCFQCFLKGLTECWKGFMSDSETGQHQGSKPEVTAIGTGTRTTGAPNLS